MNQNDLASKITPTAESALKTLAPDRLFWSSAVDSWNGAWQSAPKNLETFFLCPSDYHHETVLSLRQRSGSMEFIRKTRVFSGPFCETIPDIVAYSQENIPYFQNRNSPTTQVVPLVSPEELKALLLFIAATRNYDDDFALMMDYYDDRLSISFAVKSDDISSSLFDQQSNNPVLLYFEKLGLFTLERRRLLRRLLSSRRFSESLTFTTEQIILLPPFVKDTLSPFSGTSGIIFAYLQTHPLASRKQIAKALSLSDRTVGFHLRNLAQMRVLKIHGFGRATLYSVNEGMRF